jgi:hypothetical protein
LSSKGKSILAVQAQEVPGLSFHVAEKLDCAGKQSVARNKERIIACSERSRYVTEIWLSEDKPENWLGLAADGIDYANRLYLSRAHMGEVAQQVLDELGNPELKKKYHGTIDVRELK